MIKINGFFFKLWNIASRTEHHLDHFTLGLVFDKVQVLPKGPVGPVGPLGVREDVKRPVALCCMFKANKMHEAKAKK